MIAPIPVVTAGTLPSGFDPRPFADRIEFQVAHTDDELHSLVRHAHVMYSWKIPESVPSDTPNLRWIHLPSAGADHIQELPVWRSDVVITASMGIHTVPMAEHMFAMLLALTRRIPALVRAQDSKHWLHDRRGARLELTELRGKTMGIVGWGKIGAGIVHLARAFGMHVIGTRYSIHVPQEVPNEGSGAFTDAPFTEPLEIGPDIVYPAAQLHDVLEQSDVVVLILPLTDETKHSFGNAEFRAMKRGALFFNIGRGAVVEEKELVRALQEGKVAGAGLDVFEQEPLFKGSPLWGMQNVIVSPHVGGVDERTQHRTWHFFVVNLQRFLDGQPLLNLVHRQQGY
ncbi:MAG: D-2-hydroxyacid dehydrogenase [Ktedonobacteraceae bacterium]